MIFTITATRRFPIDRPRGSTEHVFPSRIGLGSASFGNLFRENTDENTLAAVSAALAAGVTYIDTAPHYGLGLAERRLGRALAEIPSADVVLSTKVGRLLVPTPEDAHLPDPEGFLVPSTHRRVWDFGRDGVLRSLDGSLARLGRDRIDIAFLHDPDDHWPTASTTGIDTLLELRDAGIVDAVGVGVNRSDVASDYVRRFDIDVVMIAGRYTLLDQSALDDLLPLAVERGVDVVAAGVYNSGLLSRAIVSDDAPFEYGRAPRRVVDRARAIAAVCADHGVALPEAAVQFPLRHPAVVSAVLGARDAAEVQGGIERSVADVPDELWAELEALDLVRRAG